MGNLRKLGQELKGTPVSSPCETYALGISALVDNKTLVDVAGGNNNNVYHMKTFDDFLEFSGKLAVEEICDSIT